MSGVVAADIGGTNVRVAVVRGADVLYRTSAQTPATAGSSAVVETLLDLISGARRRCDDDVQGVGVSSAGVVHPVTGMISHATDLIRGWAGTPLAELVQRATGLKTWAINDVHAHALGESRWGAGRGAAVMLLVAAGTGLGGALVIEGRVLPGQHGAAGHLGHIPSADAWGLPCSCGHPGHLEAIASGSGLESLYRTLAGRSGDERIPASRIAAMATDDAVAMEAVERCGAALGHALGGMLNTLDPNVVVVTGGLANAGPLWWDAVRSGVREEALAAVVSTPVVPAERPDDAALLGAASLVTEQLARRFER